MELKLYSTFKDVIQCINPIIPTVDNYWYYLASCDKAFAMIDPKHNQLLLNYLLSHLNCSTFSFVVGVTYYTWNDLKFALNEHFGVRFNERSLLYNLITAKKTSSQDLFSFYNDLLHKCRQYLDFLHNGSDTLRFQFKKQQAEDYIKDSFVLAVGMNLRPTLVTMKPKDIHEAYNFYRNLEMETGMKSSDSNDLMINNQIQFNSNICSLEESGRVNSSGLFRNNFVHNNVDNSNSVVAVDKSLVLNNNLRVLRCQVCQKKGHTASRCYKFKKIKKYLPISDNNYNGN